MKVIPNYGRVIASEVKEQKTETGIILTEVSSSTGVFEVISVAADMQEYDDKIIYVNARAGAEIEIDGISYKTFRKDEILATKEK